MTMAMLVQMIFVPMEYAHTLQYPDAVLLQHNVMTELHVPLIHVVEMSVSTMQ